MQERGPCFGAIADYKRFLFSFFFSHTLLLTYSHRFLQATTANLRQALLNFGAFGKDIAPRWTISESRLTSQEALSATPRRQVHKGSDGVLT